MGLTNKGAGLLHSLHLGHIRDHSRRFLALRLIADLIDQATVSLKPLSDMSRMQGSFRLLLDGGVAVKISHRELNLSTSYSS